MKGIFGQRVTMVFVSILAMLILSGCGWFDTDATMVSIEIPEEYQHVEIQQGTLPFDEIELIIHYDDGTQTRIPLNAAMFDEAMLALLETPGFHTIVLEHEGFETTFDVLIVQNVLESTLRALHISGYNAGLIDDDYETWLASIRGEDGKSVELRVEGDMIEWRHEDGTWQSLIALDALQGPKGQSAFEIFLTYNPDFTGTEADWIASFSYEGNLDITHKPIGTFIPSSLAFNSLNDEDVITVMGVLHHEQLAFGEGGALIKRDYFTLHDAFGTMELLHQDATIIWQDYINHIIKIDVTLSYCEDGMFVATPHTYQSIAFASEERFAMLETLQSLLVETPDFVINTGINLPTFSGEHDAILPWTSSHPDLLAHNGSFVSRPDENIMVTFTTEAWFGDYKRPIQLQTMVIPDYASIPSDASGTLAMRAVIYHHETLNRRHFMIYDGISYGMARVNGVIADEALVDIGNTLIIQGQIDSSVSHLQMIAMHELDALKIASDSIDMPPVYENLTPAMIYASPPPAGAQVHINGYGGGTFISNVVYGRIYDDTGVYVLTHYLTENYWNNPVEAYGLLYYQEIGGHGLYYRLAYASITLIETLPDGWPPDEYAGEDLADVPRYPDTIRTFYYDGTELNGDTIEITYETLDAIEDIVDFYINSLEDFGYESIEHYTLSDSDIIDAFKSNISLSIMIQESHDFDGAIAIHITYTNLVVPQ